MFQTEGDYCPAAGTAVHVVPPFVVPYSLPFWSTPHPEFSEIIE